MQAAVMTGVARAGRRAWVGGCRDRVDDFFAFTAKAPFIQGMTLHTIDLCFQDTPGLIAAYVVECGGGELALVEPGPGSSLEHLRAGLRERNLDEKAVRHVFVTHVHLDHAGAAGWWAGQGARVYCHANAAPHLVDPSRLLKSARMIYQDQMDRLWGEMLPAPAAQVQVLADLETVRVGGVEFAAWDTPGHARHHHAFVAGGVCFTGDVAGMRLQGTNYLSVTAAPPQFDPPAYVASVDRLRAAGFDRLYLAHFGEVRDVAAHLSRYRERIQEVHANVRAWKSAGCDGAENRLRYAEAEHAEAMKTGMTEADWQRSELGNATGMCADGVRLYVDKSP